MVVVGQWTSRELTQISEDKDLAVPVYTSPQNPESRCKRLNKSPCQQTEILFKAIHRMHCGP